MDKSSGPLTRHILPSKSIGDEPDNIEESNIFGCLITPEKNIEEPVKWVIASAEQGTRQYILRALKVANNL